MGHSVSLGTARHNPPLQADPRRQRSRSRRGATASVASVHRRALSPGRLSGQLFYGASQDQVWRERPVSRGRLSPTGGGGRRQPWRSGRVPGSPAAPVGWAWRFGRMRVEGGTSEASAAGLRASGHVGASPRRRRRTHRCRPTKGASVFAPAGPSAYPPVPLTAAPRALRG